MPSRSSIAQPQLDGEYGEEIYLAAAFFGATTQLAISC